jgi:Flp pilus assembly pilin Flp
MLLANERGQGLVEYVILVALVGVASIGLVRVLQHTIKVNMANAIHALQSDKKRRQAFERIDESDVKKSDFSDFMNGAAKRDAE